MRLRVLRKRQRSSSRMLAQVEIEYEFHGAVVAVPYTMLTLGPIEVMFNNPFLKEDPLP